MRAVEIAKPGGPEVLTPVTRALPNIFFTEMLVFFCLHKQFLTNNM